MNLLAVDIGNTDIKFGIFRDGQLSDYWRATGSYTHPESFSNLLRESLSRTDNRFERLVYTSVVPDVESVFRKTIQFCFDLPAHHIFSVQPGQICSPLNINGYSTGQLGMDRLVNACGAVLLYPKTNLIVVDFGTATTFDLVCADAVYRGGAITPGLKTFSASLALKTAKLPDVNLLHEPYANLAIGMNTLDCMKAGLGLGYRGLIRELLDISFQTLKALQPEPDEVEAINDSPILIIATGGLAEPVLRLCGLETQFQILDPALTLKGLYLLYQHNHSSNLIP